jgi:hypothetical protein
MDKEIIDQAYQELSEGIAHVSDEYSDDNEGIDSFEEFIKDKYVSIPYESAVKLSEFLFSLRR